MAPEMAFEVGVEIGREVSLNDPNNIPRITHLACPIDMKTLLLSSLLALLASVPAIAELPLKLELLAPKGPVILNAAQLIKPGDGAAAPKVDITLRYRITNTGKEAITLEHGGDATTNALVVKGPGAVNVPYKGMMTMEFRMGKPITLAAGEAKEFEIKGLKYGARDMSYWSVTKSGDYEVTLAHHTRSC